MTKWIGGFMIKRVLKSVAALIVSVNMWIIKYIMDLALKY